MRKPWEESGSHRDDFSFEDRPRRTDRRFDDRDGFKRRSDRRFDRREDGFGRRDEGFGRRDRRRDDRKGGFAKRRDDFSDNVYGVRSGPRARAAMAGRGVPARRQSAPSRNALITLDLPDALPPKITADFKSSASPDIIFLFTENVFISRIVSSFVASRLISFSE